MKIHLNHSTFKTPLPLFQWASRHHHTPRLMAFCVDRNLSVISLKWEGNANGN